MIKFLFKKIQKFIFCYYWLFFPKKIDKLNLNDLNFSQNLKLKQNEINETKKRFINKSLEEDEDLKKRIAYHKEKNSKLKYKVLKFIRLNQLKRALELSENDKKMQKLDFIEQFKKVLILANDLTIKNNSKLLLNF